MPNTTFDHNSNQGGQTFNLLRDDLGGEGDASKENYEITYSRSIPQGEYIVNVHMYRWRKWKFPASTRISP
jgi:hypothetical protein